MDFENVTVKLPKVLVKRIRLRAVQDELTMQQIMAALLEQAMTEKRR